VVVAITNHIGASVVSAAEALRVWGRRVSTAPARRYLERATSMIFSTKAANATISIAMPIMACAVSFVVVLTSLWREDCRAAVRQSDPATGGYGSGG